MLVLKTCCAAGFTDLLCCKTVVVLLALETLLFVLNPVVLVGR